MNGAILFDLVGVLLFPDDAYPSDQVLDAFDGMIGQCTDDGYLKSTALKRFHLTEMECERLLLRVADKYIPFRPLWELLPQLRRRYRLVILNNGTSLTFPAFDARDGLSMNFDLVITSGQEGYCKPDKRIYNLAMERLNLPASQCLFMDDSLENVLAAKAVGMEGIHWPDRQAGFCQFQEWLEGEPA